MARRPRWNSCIGSSVRQISGICNAAWHALVKRLGQAFIPFDALDQPRKIRFERANGACEELAVESFDEAMTALLRGY